MSRYEDGKVCVIGWPVEHSRSPMIHNTWIARHGLDAIYEKRAVPADELEDTLRYLTTLGFKGANVTVPHKESACRALVPFIDPPAERLGAVNTVYRDGEGHIRGTNTDGFGFLEHLRRSLGGDISNLKDRPAVMLGAGGAARAIADALGHEAQMDLRVVNRTTARAAALLADLDLGHCSVYDWQDLALAMDDAALLVNTTSLGMAGQPPLEIDLSHLPGHAAVYDIVYVPLETPLLKQARERELKTIDGLGMLLWQAAPGFRHWFGVEVDDDDVAAARALIEEDLKKDK